MRIKSVLLASLLGGAVLSGSAQAALQLSEIFANAPGGGDNGFEFVEIIGAPVESLTNVWLVVIEGNGAGAGVVDVAKNLGTLSPTVGANGLLLIRDAATN